MVRLTDALMLRKEVGGMDFKRVVSRFYQITKKSTYWQQWFYIPQITEIAPKACFEITAASTLQAGSVMDNHNCYIQEDYARGDWVEQIDICERTVWGNLSKCLMEDRAEFEDHS